MNGEVIVACGDEHAVVVKDYDVVYDSTTDNTVYTFVIKNGITFSDGKPLTINDVLFNLYVYLDPVYTGSSTMYSTDILGLKDYRTQTVSSGDSNTDDPGYLLQCPPILPLPMRRPASAMAQRW